MKILLFLSLILCYATGFGQEFKSDKKFEKYVQAQLKISSESEKIDFNEKIYPEKCLADLKVLKATLEEAQTTIYRYASEQEVEIAFQSAFKAAEEGLTYLELLQEIAKIQNVIACGHSWWGHSQEYIKYKNEELKFFPFEMRYDGSRCLLFQNNSREQDIYDDVQLISLNGEPIDSVLWKMKKFTNRDGTSMDNSLREPAKYFVNAYSNFVAQPDEFEITYFEEGFDGLITRKIKALPKSEIDSIRKMKYPDWKKHGKPLKLELHPELDAAIYTIEWFKKDYLESQGQDFEAFADSAFTVLNEKNVGNLVIDLRANTGGWTAYGKYLFSYFIEEPTPYLSKVVTNRFKDYSFEEIILQDPEYLDSFEMVLNDDGLYVWSKYPNATAYPPQKNIYKGQVYILIDNFTRSCSGMFSSLMREHTNAIFIGEETGATQCGAGGMVASICLPHSGIKVNFSTGKYVAQVSDVNNSRGVVPDYEYDGFLTGSYDLTFILGYLKNR